MALRAFAGGVHLIAGRRGKQQDFTALAAPVAEHCRAVYLIGEAAAELAHALAAAGVELRQAGDLRVQLRAGEIEHVMGEADPPLDRGDPRGSRAGPDVELVGAHKRHGRAGRELRG